MLLKDLTLLFAHKLTVKLLKKLVYENIFGPAKLSYWQL